MNTSAATKTRGQALLGSFELWLAWILASFPGYLFGSLLIYGCISLLIGGGVLHMEAAGFFVIILPTLGLTSVVSGLVAGGLQFLALRRWLERPRTWIPWTILAWILAWLGPFIVLILSKSDIDTPPLLGLTGMVAGAIMGTCQWMVLRRTVKAAIWWIPASALGWALGLFMLYFVRGDSLLRIAAAASMVSMVTGFALVVLLVRPAHGVKTPRSWR